MKLLLISIIFISLGAEKVYQPPVEGNRTCNKALMSSYKLDWSNEPVVTKNLICPNIKFNCCNFHAQFMVYNMWVKSRLRTKLLRLYKTIIATYSLIFDDFHGVEKLAEVVMNQLEAGVETNCGEMAIRIITLKASKLKESVLTAAKRAFKTIYTARRGFYCSLCDQQAHKNFRTDQGSINFSYGFCGTLVKDTMNWSLFKMNHFPKLARLYGQFLSSCSATGDYVEKDNLRDNLKFFRDNKLFKLADVCVKRMKEEHGFNHCFGYCDQFNPVKFSEMFEGDFGRILQFRVWMSKVIDEKLEAGESGGSKIDLSFQGRVLQDKTAQKTSIKQKLVNAVTNLLNWNWKESNLEHFNRDYRAKILEPITYKASENFPTNKTLDFESSIFKLRAKSLFDLADFRGRMDTNGINHLKYGFMIRTDKKTRNKLFDGLTRSNKRLIEDVDNPASVNYRYSTNDLATTITIAKKKKKKKTPKNNPQQTQNKQQPI